MKSDLRDSFGQHVDEYKSKGMEPISASKGEEMKKSIAAQTYIECSARMQYNLKEVFESAIKVVLHPPSSLPSKSSENEEASGNCCEIA
jgi:Ras-related C3 botulinum toxin substrate 1